MCLPDPQIVTAGKVRSVTGMVAVFNVVITCTHRDRSQNMVKMDIFLDAVAPQVLTPVSNSLTFLLVDAILIVDSR